MKKAFLVAAAVMLTVSVAAQQAKKGSSEFSITAGYDFGLKKNSGGMVSIQPELGKHFGDQFYFGVGTGILADDNFDFLYVPAFARVQVDFPSQNITPYISLQGGYDFNVSGGGDSWARVSPSIGLRVPMGNSTSFNIAAAYTRAIVSGNGFDYLGFRAGLAFDASGHGLARFFKKLEYDIEAEYMPLTVTDKYDESEYRCNNFIELRFSALYPLSDKLYAGLTAGAGKYTEKYVFKGGGDIDKDSYVYANVMARVKYKAKQLAISDKIYPFAQVDAGAVIYDETNFTINPAAGISIATGQDHSIDVSAGYYRF